MDTALPLPLQQTSMFEPMVRAQSAVLPDLAICRHLGDFFNHLATNILIWRLGNLATFWATF